MTAQELIKKLQEFDPKLEVGIFAGRWYYEINSVEEDSPGTENAEIILKAGRPVVM